MRSNSVTILTAMLGFIALAISSCSNPSQSSDDDDVGGSDLLVSNLVVSVDGAAILQTVEYDIESDAPFTGITVEIQTSDSTDFASTETVFQSTFDFPAGQQSYSFTYDDFFTWIGGGSWTNFGPFYVRIVVNIGENDDIDAANNSAFSSTVAYWAN